MNRFRLKLLLFILIFCLISPNAYGVDEYTDDLIPTMTSNTEPSGEVSADVEYSSSYKAFQACDDNEVGLPWTTDNSALPHWWKYDFGSGVTKTIVKLRLKSYYDINGGRVDAFKLEGSNNDSDWTELLSDNHADDDEWEDYVFSNTTAYRYYMITVSSNHRVDNYVAFNEIEMMETVPVSQVIIIK